MSDKVQLPQILFNLGIAALNPMQLEALEAIQTEKNTLLLAPTGSGKTLAFLLPVLNMLNPAIPKVQCLVLAPTRELAIQIEQVWKKMNTGFKVNVCYGGHDMSTEKRNLSQPPAVLIGTPGRIADHLTRRTFELNEIHTLVLDEFDKSLELGFQDQMSYIIGALSRLKKTVLVSATSSIEIPEFTKVRSPKTLNFTSDHDAKIDLTLKSVTTDEREKISTLFRLICSLKGEPALIFFNHREAAEEVNKALSSKGICCTVYHGGMDQEDRERALIHFRNGTIPYLLTTDIAARGLDIPQMKHVIHYQLSLKEAEFTHRNGRTARMLASGTAYLLFHKGKDRPTFLREPIDELILDKNYPVPPAPEFETLYINGGRKTNLSKMDIVGFFSQKGKLSKEDIGLIEVADYSSFVAVRKSKTRELLNFIREEKMKGKKYKIGIAEIGTKKPRAVHPRD